MGHINMLASSFAVSLSEDAGERSGIALNQDQLLQHLPIGHRFREMLGGEDKMLRVASDEYADAVGDVLYALGAADQPGMPTVTQRLIARLGPDWRSKIEIMKMMQVEAIAVHYLFERAATGRFDMEGFEYDMEDAIGDARRFLMDDLLEVLPVHLAQAPYFTRAERATDPIALTNLFESEKLPVDGTFFDQRFVNYLATKPDLVHAMHWRQFEGFAAEWLARQGYDVELGPGRDDGGVDVRAWRSGSSPGTPPAMIVQCKRQKNKIEKVVVKGLWADLHAEDAETGLIVTTSDLSPGAAKVIEARAYPVTVANEEQVKSWLLEMRQPQAGMVL